MNVNHDADLAQLFVECSRAQLMDECWPRLRATVERLTDEQVWWRPNSASNSIGNLLLHLNGNVNQWLVESFNGGPDGRDRPAEFKAAGSISAAALLEKLSATLEQACAVLARLAPSELRAMHDIQGYRVRGLDAVYHVVEHFSMHYGQILYIAKMLTAEDLGFYSELNETGRIE